jgi:hypothetical protein
VNPEILGCRDALPGAGLSKAKPDVRPACTNSRARLEFNEWGQAVGEAETANFWTGMERIFAVSAPSTYVSPSYGNTG